tara:strand:- start:466 stop:720 length:255 start_codon:yes stop_codon:yes gene_type:complete
MTDLSPAAAKAFNAAWAETGIILGDHAGTLRAQLAAALRAVADQVAPETPLTRPGTPEVLVGLLGERRIIRLDLLAIATELEAQ